MSGIGLQFAFLMSCFCILIRHNLTSDVFHRCQSELINIVILESNYSSLSRLSKETNRFPNVDYANCRLFNV